MTGFQEQRKQRLQELKTYIEKEEPSKTELYREAGINYGISKATVDEHLDQLGVKIDGEKVELK